MIEDITAQQGINTQLKVLISACGGNGYGNRFTVGQVLQGMVLQQIGDHRFLMDFNGIQVVAESMIPLKPGQQIAVRVDLTYPRVVMSPAGEGNAEEKALLSLLRSFLPVRLSWGELVTRLGTLLADQERSRSALPIERQVLERVVTLLSSLSGGEEQAGDAEKIKRFIEDTGIFYESKLKHALVREGSSRENLRESIARDCKGLLLKLSQELKHEPVKMAESGETQVKSSLQTLAKTVDESIDNIELQQLVNCLASKKEEQLVFQIPVLLPEGMRTAELYIRSGSRRGTKGGLNKEDIHLVFLLTMQSLGDLRMDARLSKQKIRCAIEVSTPEGAHFVRQHLGLLSERLAALDYTVEQLTCAVKKAGDKKATPPEGFSLLEMKFIDIRA